MALRNQTATADWVAGDAGDNVLAGSAGDDIFVMTGGHDVITDFAPTRAGKPLLIDFDGEDVPRTLAGNSNLRFDGAQIRPGYLGLQWFSSFRVFQDENGLALNSGDQYGANWNGRHRTANEVVYFAAPAEDFDLQSGFFAVQRFSVGLETRIEAWDDGVRVGEAVLDFSTAKSFVDFQAGAATNLDRVSSAQFSGRFTSIDKVVFRTLTSVLLEMDDLLLKMGGGDRIAVPAGTDIGALVAGATSDGHGGTLLTHAGGQLDLQGIAPGSAQADWFVRSNGLRDQSYNVITWDPRGEFDSGGTLQLDSEYFEATDISKIIDWVSRTGTEPGYGVTAFLKNAFEAKDYHPIAPVPRATNDAYVVTTAATLAMLAPRGVLANDHAAPGSVVELVDAPSHGTVVLTGEGGFSYTPETGYVGIDAFQYRLVDGATAVASFFIVPTTADSITRLDFGSLTTEEQVASMYLAFLGRGAERDGFDLWVDLVNGGLPARAAGTLGTGAESQALYPLLAHPAGSSDGQISLFLETVYDVLFNRSPDAAGLAYWTQEVGKAIVGGRFVGQVLYEILGGAQNSAAGQDITTLMSKVAVSLEYVEAQRSADSEWTLADDQADAIALVAPVTDRPETVLAGIRNAYDLVSIENVIGSAFDDRLTGDAGNNVLTGGAGSDIFVLTKGKDVITDFTWLDGSPISDHLLYDIAGPITIDYMIQNAVADGKGGTLLKYQGGQVDLQGIDPASVKAEWFI